MTSSFFLLSVAMLHRHGKHYYKILPRNQSIDSDPDIDFLDNMELFNRNLQTPILFENMRLKMRMPVLIGQDRQKHTWRIKMYDCWGNQHSHQTAINLTDIFFLEWKQCEIAILKMKKNYLNFWNNNYPQFTAQRMRKAVEELKKDMKMIIEYCLNIGTGIIFS